MLSIKNMEISRALPLLALTPGFVAIFAFVFINDSLSFLQVFAILLLLSGTYILETRSGQKLLDPFKVFVKSKNHHYVVLALILFTTTSIIDRLLLKQYQLPPNAFIGFQHVFFAINFLIIYLIFKKDIGRLFRLKSEYLWYLIILISILTVIYRYTEILAVKIAPVAMVLSVKRISIFFAVLIGGKIFKEKNLLIKTIAAVLIIAGIILITR
jgi:drug/metabolite transporter (DMT)-like permease